VKANPIDACVAENWDLLEVILEKKLTKSYDRVDLGTSQISLLF
jgi:hypothetical protein